MFRKNNASAFGIIGNVDEKTIKYFENKTSKRIRKVERKGKTKLIIGKGLFKKTIKID